MPRLYTAVRRPIKQRTVNPVLLPETPKPAPEPEPEPVPVPDEPSTDMTLAQLKERADAAGVPSYGTKADIVARLTDG